MARARARARPDRSAHRNFFPYRGGAAKDDKGEDARRETRKLRHVRIYVRTEFDSIKRESICRATSQSEKASAKFVSFSSGAQAEAAHRAGGAASDPHILFNCESRWINRVRGCSLKRQGRAAPAPGIITRQKEENTGDREFPRHPVWPGASRV